jgi:hypothetical protein
MTKLRNLFFLFALGLMCCKKPYNPPPTSTSKSYLVVEGVINLSTDSTVIKISRTVKLNDSVAIKPVLGATVYVEGESGRYNPSLDDIRNNGHYWTYAINLPTNERYRLVITTPEGEQYVSDYVSVKPTPPIDSIGYNVKDGNVNLYVNAHDPTNNTRYYLWDYEETWQFHAKYPSYFYLNPATNSITARPPLTQVYTCFSNDASSHVLVSSTEALSSDVVYQAPLTQIPLTSEKVEAKYSILVRQYAVSKEAYQFYQTMLKNTEQLGSIFDAQPSQITGNIHNIKDKSEPVIGYISVTNVQTKRIFVPHADLPGNVQPKYPYDCTQDSALYSNKQHFNDVQNILVNPPVSYIPTEGIYSNGVLIGFMYSSPVCADCTLRGTVTAPLWWQ